MAQPIYDTLLQSDSLVVQIMPEVGPVTEVIGSIGQFPSVDKLARNAGIVPVDNSSG